MFAEIESIEKESFGEPWSKEILEKMFYNEKYHFKVYKSEEQIQGYSIFMKVIDEIEILRIAVSQKERRKGIAKEIIKSIILYARENCVKKIFLEVRENNNPAKYLYEKMGFKVIGIRKNYYKDTGENAIVMQNEVEYAD